MQSSVRTTTTIVVELIMPDKQFIGVDVSKGWIDVATAGRPGHRRIDNCDAAIQHWLGTLDTASVDLVAFEPTGGYERPLKRALRRAGLAFARVHPNEIVAFRRRRGVKAKTDPIDARLLADFAAIELASRGLAPAGRGQRDTARTVGPPAAVGRHPAGRTLSRRNGQLGGRES